MREILFKAKRVDNGNWVVSMTICKGTIPRKKDLVYLELGERIYVQVDPNTVGEITGLLDKHGERFFEGDKGLCQFGTFTVEFHDGCFWATFEDGVRLPLYTWNEDSEIIGNIHDK